jgi:hypothetical protein
VRATLGVVPLAILGLGCGHLRPWTPSVSVAFWEENVPAGREVEVPSAVDLAARWQLPAASPWARYGKATLISAVDPMAGVATLPDTRRLEVVARAEAAAARVAKSGLPANTLWVVDLRGAASAAFASRLSIDSREPVAPVLTFNNWPAPEALLPADETLAGLLEYPPKLPPPEENAIKNAHPVFVLDAWRLAFRFDDPGEDVYDNRYMLTSSDLPQPHVLSENGITSVVYVVEDLDDAEVEEDDLNAIFRSWQAAGVSIFFVDLDTLQNDGFVPGPSYQAVFRYRYWPRERWTILDDPGFYYRARGGFGLVYGRPYIYPGYGAYSYGHHPGYGAHYFSTAGPHGSASHGGFGG